MEKIFFFILILLFPAVLPLHAEDVQVTSNFDKRSAQVDEEIHLNIRINGGKGNIQAPRLPGLKDIDTYYAGRSSRLTFINGVSTSTMEFSYVLIPRAAGRYTVPSIEVSVDGKVFRTDPVDVEVAGGGRSQVTSAPSVPAPLIPRTQAPVQEPPMTFQPDDENIFVKAWVDKTSVYPNEQILLTYSLYTRYDTRYEGFQEEPQTSGFWIEEFPMDREIPRETVRMAGKRYVKADIKKVALFPTTAAEYTINPGTLKASIREEPQSSGVFDEFFNDSFFSGGSFFAQRQNRLLKPPVIHITVKPFPEAGKPASFDGAVGNFRLSSTADKEIVKQNEPVTMKIVIEGEGNIETLTKPVLPEIAGFKVYDSDTSSQLFKTGNVIGGRKVFEIVFIPLEAGEKKIPSIEFSFFNPARAQYATLRTPVYNLKVEPSAQTFQMPAALSQQEIFKKNIQVEKRDIRYIHENIPSEKGARILNAFYYGLIALDVLLTLLVLLGVSRDRTERIFAKDEGLRRNRLAKSQAEIGMRRLKVFERSKDPKATAQFFDQIEKILSQYLSDKFNLSAYGMTRNELEAQLMRTLGPEDPLHTNILEFYRICDEHRFGKGAVLVEHRNDALRLLRETIARVEKMKK
ncbi:MAG: protein BatD [Candidatus Omnitrophica bacterium]|nr:protein BatD [Candidatus Omnitrophota bacterium]